MVEHYEIAAENKVYVRDAGGLFISRGQRMELTAEIVGEIADCAARERCHSIVFPAACVQYPLQLIDRVGLTADRLVP
ncbi:MAG TPA: hypothetical protein P5287_04760 [bacterium]|nr:hypothetical protein [bacterium]